jgi:pantoate--beta-alanine ligase
MRTLVTSSEMTAWADARHGEGRRIGFVPTMGFLHSGHTSLMDHARGLCDELVVSIFVNPLQFGPNEDLDRYPRDHAGDTAKCEAHGVDCLFMPPDLYPDGFSTAVAVHGITDGLCGAGRPGHFAGVATVVARLFGVTRADVAVFGEKDYQQLAVIRRMVRDLAMPIEVVGGALVRDADGLALSSRNKFLSEAERRRALSLSAALFAMAESDATDVSELLALGRSILDVDSEDYLAVVDAETLEPLVVRDRPARALVAGFLGKTRLIDNVAL